MMLREPWMWVAILVGSAGRVWLPFPSWIGSGVAALALGCAFLAGYKARARG